MGLLTFSPSYALFTALHVVCFALGLAVCGLYGQDLKRAADSDTDPDSKWVRILPLLILLSGKENPADNPRSTPSSWARCRP